MFSTCANTSVNYAKNVLLDSVLVPVIKVFSSVLKLGKKLVFMAGGLLQHSLLFGVKPVGKAP